MNSYLRVNSFFPATTRNSINNENYNILNKTFNFQKNNININKDKIKREFGKEISNKNMLTSINENVSKEKFKIKSENINKININKKYINKGVLKVNRISLGKKNKILNLNNVNVAKKKGKTLALSCLPLDKTMMTIKPILTFNNNNHRYNNHNTHNKYNITTNKNENNNNNNLLNNIKSTVIINNNNKENNNNNNKENNNNNINNNKENTLKISNDNNNIQSKEENENNNENLQNKLKTFSSTLEFNLNPQIPKEYLSDILTHLYSLENGTKNNISFPNPSYFSTIQKDIKERMRYILLDWLIEVHLKFKLLPETLFLTINILDRYLSLQSIHRKYLQLLGVTSMFISCKYEEIYYPKIKDFIYMTDNAYNKEEFIKMENDVLKKLEFNLSFPTILKFLEIFKEKLNVKNKKKFLMWRYLSEICLFDYGMIRYKNSLIAAAIVYFENKFWNFEKILENEIFDKICEKNENYFNEIKELCEKIKFLYKINENSNYHAIKKKFSMSVFQEVAKEKVIF